MHKFLTFHGIMFFLLIPTVLFAQKWNPDAGLVSPYPVTLYASSGNKVGNITDDNPATFWQSGNPLPYAYIHRPDLNLFLNHKNFSTLPNGNFFKAFDGNTDSKTSIPQGPLEISFQKLENINTGTKQMINTFQPKNHLPLF